MNAAPCVSVPPASFCPFRRARAGWSAILYAVTAGCVLALAAVPSGDAAIALTNLHGFALDDIPADGFQPATAPVLASDGNFYGTAQAGGAFITSDPFGEGYGTIYRLTPGGVLTTLHSFNGNDGRFPRGPLIPAGDGNLYGLTEGTFFRETLDGTFTVLHTFDGSGIPYPSGDLMPGLDGTFYGLAAPYPAGNPATAVIYQLTTDGALTTVCTFALPDDYGAYQNILLASDGNYYGTSSSSRRGPGFIYRVTPGGVVTMVHEFDASTDGYYAQTALVQGRDGALYGTTDKNGDDLSDTLTTIYRVALDGTFTTLRKFDYTDPGAGINPAEPLLPGSDGNLYGTTAGVDDQDPGNYTPYNGTVYRITPQGEYTTLRVFSGTTDGTRPTGRLFELPGGSFLGATLGGGGLDSPVGTIYRLDLDAAPAAPVVTATVVQQNVMFYQADGTQVEVGDVDVGIVFTLDRTTDTRLKVFFHVKGSAQPGVDYDGLPKKVKFKPGETSKFISLRSHPDNVSATDHKVIRLRLLPRDGYTVGTAGPVKDVLSHYY